MKTLEQITNDEKVGNLGPDELLIHARHIYLSAAKDLMTDCRHPDDQKMGEHCADIACALQYAIEVWSAP